MSPRRHSPLGGFSGRIGLALGLVGLAVTASAIAPSWGGGAPAADAAATQTVAMYEMNEAGTATVLVDSSGNELNGAIGPNAVPGVVFDGATAHRFLDRSPTLPPTEPERLDTVPSSPLLNPDSQDWAITVRYRTSKSFGNLVQKGQNGTYGGYFKIELPFGRPTCLFKGLDSGGNVVQGAVTPPVFTPTPEQPNDPWVLKDNQWHTIRCERLQGRVTLYIDGAEVNRKVGATGNIANNVNLSIAGKSNCDQIETTCDYFVGDIDWIRIEKGDGVVPNEPPSASFTRTCTSSGVCTFNAGASRDGDGQIVRYDWDFGDGTPVVSETDASASHTYLTGGSKTVRLTVVDDDGAMDDTTRSFSVTVPTTTTTSTTTSTTTTTTIVDQQGPTVIDEVPDAAGASQVAVRLTPTASP